MCRNRAMGVFFSFIFISILVGFAYTVGNRNGMDAYHKMCFSKQARMFEHPKDKTIIICAAKGLSQ